MTDDEIIETFLKENQVELRKASVRFHFRNIGTILVSSFIVACLAMRPIMWIDSDHERKAAIQKQINEDNILIAERKKEADDLEAALRAKNDAAIRKAEDELKARKAHEEAQYAYITVQYAADGHDIGCWITQHKDEVVHLSSNTPSAYAYISNYKDYPSYANVLHMNPKKCIVWTWEGQDP